MDEEALRTPHSSVLTSHQSPQQSVTSPGSTVTLTPTSTKDATPAEKTTPSSIPLPPVTPGEEAALKTPNAPTTTSEISRQSVEALSPIASVKELEGEGDGEKVDESFDETSTRRTTLRSTGSSSSTSLEVSEILEGGRPVNPPEDTEEIEEEFEDAKGDMEEDEEEIGHVELHQRGDASDEADNTANREEEQGNWSFVHQGPNISNFPEGFMDNRKLAKAFLRPI